MPVANHLLLMQEVAVEDDSATRKMLNMIKACTVAQDKVEDAKSLLVTNSKIDNQA